MFWIKCWGSFEAAHCACTAHATPLGALTHALCVPVPVSVHVPVCLCMCLYLCVMLIHVDNIYDTCGPGNMMSSTAKTAAHMSRLDVSTETNEVLRGDPPCVHTRHTTHEPYRYTAVFLLC